jgi:hypothetical protein
LKGAGLSRNAEEARVRKVVDTSFFEKIFGAQWLKTTVAAIEKSVVPVEKGGRLYQGYTPAAVELLYQQMGRVGFNLEKNSLHDQILANMVFIFANSEASLLAALDFEDGRD